MRLNGEINNCLGLVSQSRRDGIAISYVALDEIMPAVIQSIEIIQVAGVSESVEIRDLERRVVLAKATLFVLPLARERFLDMTGAVRYNNFLTPYIVVAEILVLRSTCDSIRASTSAAALDQQFRRAELSLQRPGR